ncbi:MAG: nucleotidyl transferase AbiEii/AbiGii toxin family protein [Deltaproteobacteria bacterium]|nr:nucleotidyl transferase AbiEii/AbiGii toxin family protein [Deltaproteobacteria bacterium]
MEIDCKSGREDTRKTGMIPLREIRERARESGVPNTTIERDYAQNWLLKHLSSMNMALKGGTGIRKTYIENYRFSDDLDFTLLEKTDTAMVKDLVMRAVSETKEESGINFNDGIQIEENINGFEVISYFRILRTSGTPIRIKLDLTGYEKEDILLPAEIRDIIHPYSDNCRFQIRVYSLEEILAEKIRSLFERTRPRDMYDTWYLHDIIDRVKILSVLQEKFKFKNIAPDIFSLEDRKLDFANAWQSSLSHQIKELPDFNYVYNEVIKQVRAYATN